MKKETYDKIGIVSVLLKDKIGELDKCQKEKEEILKEIEELKNNNELMERYPLMKKKMDDNLKKINKVVEEIRKLNEIVSQ